MPALLARSQSIEVEQFTAFGPRFFDESLKLRTRTRIVYDSLPMLVALRKLTQFIKHSTPLLVSKFRQLLNDFRCAHGESIVSVIRFVRERKVRDREGALASKREARAPRNSFHLDFDRQQMIDHVGAAIGIAMRWLRSA